MPRKPAKSSRIKRLCELCLEAIETFKPETKTLENGETFDVTYCNQAVSYVCSNFTPAYAGFQRLLANQIVQKMDKDPEWAEVSAMDAKKLADDGRLVIAGGQADPHGHVAVVFPNREMEWSKKWHRAVPVVSSVGRKNWVVGANWAFRDPPRYWAWVEP